MGGVNDKQSFGEGFKETQAGKQGAFKNAPWKDGASTSVTGDAAGRAVEGTQMGMNKLQEIMGGGRKLLPPQFGAARRPMGRPQY